jgi:hypothetical protein
MIEELKPREMDPIIKDYVSSENNRFKYPEEVKEILNMKK